MTTQFHPPDATPLKGKVVVLTGGALGVGSCIVRLLHTAGAHVFFGDILDEPGQALERELSNNDAKAKFIHCDVTSYADNLALFDAAYSACGHVDHAIANAGLGEQGNMFDSELTLESIKEEPKKSMSIVDVNVKGPLYFARVASAYLKQPDVNGKGNTAAADKSLTLVSSVAGFREDPGLYVYVASKHAILGLMRVLRGTLIQSKPHPIRTNAICPWMTKTRLVAGIEKVWAESGLPSNSPEDVARVIVGVLADGKVNGGTMYIEGGRSWNIEQGLLATRHEWLGAEREKELDRGTELMGGGEHWTANKSSQV
ncbi:hypothetical protein LTR91_015419 [Friedmanniomyces endolithicus]|uniref:3-hydroxyacyl-CoA dehydrogenase n=1 Tax=Friedmanniomyces endolithicus TaxID=329885 RepID=A0AAN6K9U9_9PEZI|nr:hypothetical protein LTR75_015670 [Friedmanniomyces endolithicus]KAK0850850.1 hypothetical protein LTR03_004360 [Friedmanniomyces endolithicus]KAK0861379.1 hypothetical protein LTS02_007866 [Friedmanniomyces endolithicus]KAK0876213.1 hypothetical protein LTR87_009973 [Friedmanniomyces endolithicus]KAK0903736.1 hypothetical protein LTR02_007420 [Friedmanniomyces endolithicus]